MAYTELLVEDTISSDFKSRTQYTHKEKKKGGWDRN